MGPLEAGARGSGAAAARSEMIRRLMTCSPCSAMAQQLEISGFNSAYINLLIYKKEVRKRSTTHFL